MFVDFAQLKVAVDVHNSANEEIHVVAMKVKDVKNRQRFEELY